MLAELRREKFTTATDVKPNSRYQFSAVRDLQGFPCRRYWTIPWNSNGGQIAKKRDTESLAFRRSTEHAREFRTLPLFLDFAPRD
jgi:hypothetical protein